jgi:hypothetical protein
MKAKPIKYKGVQFRSKLECRHFNFMKRIGWNIEYDPEVEGVYGYQPDFEIFSEIEPNEDGFSYSGSSVSGKRYFIEVKPIRSQSEFYSEKYKSFRDKVYKSGILNENVLFIVGCNLKLRTNIKGCCEEKIFVPAIRMLDENVPKKPYDMDQSVCSFSGCPEGNYEGIGLKESWNDCRSDWIKQRKDRKDYYDVCDYNLSREGWDASGCNIKTSMFIERSWNDAWSQMQWHRRGD